MPDVPAHLGGGEKKGHYDEPALLYLVERFSVVTMLDVGCGRGLMVSCAYRSGVDACGVDGDPRVKPDILHDFAEGPMPAQPLAAVDLVWSMEFVEHVEERFMPNYMEAFRRGRVVMMTYAPPGKAGRHHVNCRSANYWVEAMEDAGMRLDSESTAGIRAASDITTVVHETGEVRKGKRFIKDHGLVFTR